MLFILDINCCCAEGTVSHLHQIIPYSINIPMVLECRILPIFLYGCGMCNIFNEERSTLVSRNQGE